MNVLFTAADLVLTRRHVHGNITVSVRAFEKNIFNSDIQRAQLEICYNILYVEKHGRSLNDPWSLRQMGVYHHLRNSLQTSGWILLNPADRTKSQVKEFFEPRSDRCHLALHAKFLLSMACNWTEYIEYLGAELRKHVSDVTYLPVCGLTTAE